MGHGMAWYSNSNSDGACYAMMLCFEVEKAAEKE
jgi:hypothetical protein